jgi:hypothetical protein
MGAGAALQGTGVPNRTAAVGGSRAGARYAPVSMSRAAPQDPAASRVCGWGLGSAVDPRRGEARCIAGPAASRAAGPAAGAAGRYRKRSPDRGTASRAASEAGRWWLSPPAIAVGSPMAVGRTSATAGRTSATAGRRLARWRAACSRAKWRVACSRARWRAACSRVS